MFKGIEVFGARDIQANLAGVSTAVLLLCTMPSGALGEIVDSTLDGVSAPSLEDYSQVRTYPRWEDVRDKPVTATRWPVWNEVSAKPETATRWPRWSEIRANDGQMPLSMIDAPDGFPVAEHNHDSSYVLKKGNSTIQPGSLTIVTDQSTGHALNIQNRITDTNDNGGLGGGSTIAIVKYLDVDRDFGSYLLFRTATGLHNDRKFPMDNAHLGAITAQGWSGWREDEGDNRWLSPANITFRANGQWDEENQWGRIIFQTGNAANRVQVSDGTWHTQYEQPIVFNMGRIGVGTHSPSHQITLKGGVAAGSASPTTRGININDKLWIGESDAVARGPDMRAHNSMYLFSSTAMRLSTGSNGFYFYNNSGNPAGDYSLIDSSDFVARINGSGSVYATDYNLLSDARLKENVEDLEDPLSSITQLRPVSFSWKDERKEALGRQLGLIAQEVLEVFPEAVDDGSDGNGYLSVNYDSLVAPLIGAVKELDAQNKQLAEEQRNSALQIEALEHRIADLESLLVNQLED